MKDEIKYLLQYLKNVYESEETSTWLNKLQIKDLLDYITNLQTIEQQYSAILSENAELEQKYDMALEDNVKESKRRMKLQEEKERYKNIIDELKKEKAKKYDYVREVRTFNNNISKKDLEKFPVLKQYQGKDISYIVYESIDIL